jgi:hypothetical protein
MKNKDYSFNFIGLVGIFILIFTVGVAYLFSILSGRNALSAHYFFPMAGCLWLSISVLLAKLYSKKIIFSLMLLVLLLMGVISSVAFINYEHDINSADLKFKYYINQIDNNDTILVLDVTWAGTVYSYYSNKKIIIFDKYFSQQDIENKLNELNIIKKMQQQKGKIWLFDNSDKESKSISEFNNSLIKKGFSLSHVDETNVAYGTYPHDFYMINSLS